MYVVTISEVTYFFFNKSFIFNIPAFTFHQFLICSILIKLPIVFTAYITDNLQSFKTVDDHWSPALTSACVQFVCKHASNPDRYWFGQRKKNVVSPFGVLDKPKQVDPFSATRISLQNEGDHPYKRLIFFACSSQEHIPQGTLCNI